MIDIRKILNGYWWDAQGKFESLIKGDNFLKELTMQITDKCNLNCPKCNKVNFTFQDLPTEEAIRIINEACDLGLTHIHFTGGEPTLHEEFIHIVGYCNAMGLRIDMSSNGSFSNTYAINLFCAGMNSINVSWDFAEKKPECLSYIDDVGVRWFINHMVMPDNFIELPSFLRMIDTLPEYKSIVDIQLMPPRGTAEKFKPEQIEYFNRVIAPECYSISKGRFPMVEHKIMEILTDKDACKGVYHQPIKFPCHRSKVEIRVGTKGFTTCTYLYRDGHITCDLNSSVKDAWEACKKECCGIPPIPSMCEYSCSPEVANFNFFVEEAMAENK